MICKKVDIFIVTNDFNPEIEEFKNCDITITRYDPNAYATSLTNFNNRGRGIRVSSEEGTVTVYGDVRKSQELRIWFEHGHGSKEDAKQAFREFLIKAISIEISDLSTNYNNILELFNSIHFIYGSADSVTKATLATLNSLFTNKVHFYPESMYPDGLIMPIDQKVIENGLLNYVKNFEDMYAN